MPLSQILTSQICLLMLFAYISEFTVVCVVTDVLYICALYMYRDKKKKNKNKK